MSPLDRLDSTLGGREEFGLRQTRMTEIWFESVKARFGDVDAYIRQRQLAYLDRWHEAARFFPASPKVLDVGGGNLYVELMNFFRSEGIDYWYQDVDPSAVNGAKSLGESLGFDSSKFIQAFNDFYPYDSDSFDAVFSSHCIEHSIDLDRTFSEIHRILKTGGILTMAVPLGWEENPEHPYFFDQNHWIALLEDFGFDIRVAQIGREYPESGVDLFIAARKVSAPGIRRIKVSDFVKASYSFADCRDSRIKLSGQTYVVEEGRATKLVGEDWEVRLAFGQNTQVLPVLLRHDWSCILQIDSNRRVQTEDLFSWFPTVQPLRIDSAASNQAIKLRSAGRNPASRATEAILYGVMYR